MLSHEVSHITHTHTNLKLVYFAYLHSIIPYRIIFCGNSTLKKNIFHMQKKIIRITAGTKRKVSYRDMIRKFNFLPFASEHLLSIVTCKHGKNSYTYSVGRRHRCDLQVPHTNFNKHQKQFHHTGTKPNQTIHRHWTVSIISLLLCTSICPSKKILIYYETCMQEWWTFCDLIIFWSDCK